MNWARHYNEERPHRSLNYMAPYEFIDAYKLQSKLLITNWSTKWGTVSMFRIVIIILFFILSSTVNAQFTALTTGITSVSKGSVAWGDYDNDGDLDILITGATSNTANYNPISKVYRNNGNSTFTDINAGLIGVFESAAAWGDYDNDGDLDIIISGWDVNVNEITRIYRNNGNSTFTNINAGLTGMRLSSIAWGDYDNDGDLDILHSGYISTGGITKVYRNNGNSTFTDIDIDITADVMQCSVAWGDYDNDGDLDILITGYNWPYRNPSGISVIYRNNGDSSFTEINTGLIGVSESSTAWGDYNNDGNLDILLTGGDTNYYRKSKVYRNNGDSTFTDINAGLIGVDWGSVAWGDYDNDGNLDILLTGSTGSPVSKIYHNNGNSTFTDISAGITGVSKSSAAWGDYDNDGDLDIIITGFTSSTARTTKIYRNNTSATNSVPSAPVNLRTTLDNNNVVLMWDASFDSQTSTAGLNYVLRVGTSPGSCDVISPMANLTSGYRKKPSIGNINSVCEWKIDRNSLTQDSNYYWSVQAVDSGLRGSTFSAEAIFSNPEISLTISGGVYDTYNVGIESVTLTTSENGNCVTQLDGSYQINLPESWTGSLTASKLGWLFTPMDRSFQTITTNLTNQNFTGKLAPPSFSLSGGTYSSTQTITLSSLAEGAVRYKYTIDGSIPTANTGLPYLGQITVTQTSTINAIAYIEGKPGSASTTASASYEISQQQEDRIRFHVVCAFSSGVDIANMEVELYASTTLGLESPLRKPVDANGNVSYTFTELSAALFGFPSFSKIKIYDNNAQIGHITFNYTNADLNNSLNVDGILTIHEEHTPLGLFSGWDYYVHNEHMVSMLIKPPSIHLSRKPVMLVHGINGTYPYWNENFVSGIQSEMDVWEFYYPYDQQIDESADLLGTAISHLQSYSYYQNQGRVNVIAHSMGGLVTRSYIQGSSYNNCINKFLMIGTPNHGSYGSIKLIQGDLLANVAYLAFGNDRHAPAVKQMQSGSRFLYDLNSTNPELLYPGASNYSSYLVISGTVNNHNSVHREISGLDDFVVSVPSASLMEYDIPLITMSEHHQLVNGDGLPGGFSHYIVTNFLNDGYDPTNTGEPHYSYIRDNADVNGFWVPGYTSQDDTTLNNPRYGSLNLITDKQIGFGNLFYTVSDTNINIFNDLPTQGDPNQINRVEKNSDLVSYMFMRNHLDDNLMTGDIAFPYSDTNYRFKLFKDKLTWSGLKHICIKTSNDIPIHSFLYNSILMNLSTGEAKALNATNSKSPDGARDIVNRDGRTLRQVFYSIDSEADSVVFYLNSTENDPSFALKDFTLSTPSSQVIDSVYATTHQNTEYKESNPDAFAFYYIDNPEPGTWTMQFSNDLDNADTYCLVDGIYNLSLNLSKNDAVVGDTISVNIGIPDGIQASECSITANLLKKTESGYISNLGYIALTYSDNPVIYSGSFLADYSGQYIVSVNASISHDGSSIIRNIESYVVVDSIGTAILINPVDGSNIDNQTITFMWHNARNASHYKLNIFASDSTSPVYQTTLADTTIAITNLTSNTDYFWQIISESDSLYTTYSSIGYFSTKIDDGVCLSPADLSIDLPQLIDLTWLPISGAVNYHLQLSETNEFIFNTIDDSLLTSTSYNINNLTNDVTYYWRVAAFDEHGQGDWSIPFSFTVRSYTIDFPQSIDLDEDDSISLYLPRYIDNYHPDDYEVLITGSDHVTPAMTIGYITITPESDWSGVESIYVTVNSVERLYNIRNKQYSEFVNNRYTITDTLIVFVSPINDLPVLTLTDTLSFWDIETKTIDLTSYLADADNPINEILVSTIGSQHIGVNQMGNIIEFTPLQGWYGQETIEIRLANPNRSVTLVSQRSSNSTRTRNEYAAYVVYITIVEPTPSISGCQIDENLPVIIWNSIDGATSYKVLGAETYNGIYNDVTSTGIVSQVNDIVSWHSVNVFDHYFFKIVAVKNQSREVNSIISDPFDYRSMYKPDK